MRILLFLSLTLLPLALGQTCLEPDDQGTSVCCKGLHKPTGSFPRLPSNTARVRSLNLTFCRVKTLPPGAFSELTNLETLDISYGRFADFTKKHIQGLSNLTTLTIHYGKLKHIEKGTFGELGRLHTLDLSGNGHLTLGSLSSILHNLNVTNSIKRLYLRDVNGHHDSSQRELHVKDIEDLKGLQLDLLSLENNHIYYFDKEVLEILFNIPCLSLANNYLTAGLDEHSGYWHQNGIELVMMVQKMKIRVLDLAYESGTWPKYNGSKTIEFDFTSTCQEVLESSVSSQPIGLPGARRQFLNMKHMQSFAFPSHLEVLHMPHGITSYTWGNMQLLNNNLKYLSLDGARRCQLQSPIFGLNQLEYLSLAGSRLEFKQHAPEAFAHLPSLTHLNLSDCSIGAQMEKEGRSLIRNMSEVSVIDLSKNHLKIIHADHFGDHAPQLTELYLGQNLLTSVPNLANAKALTLLDLSFNQFTTMSLNDADTLQELAARNSEFQIILGGNPLQCQCNAETYHFLQWSQANPEVIQDWDSLNCSVAFNNIQKVEFVKNINPAMFQIECRQNLIIGVSSAIGGMLFAALIGCVICKCKRCRKERVLNSGGGFRGLLNLTDARKGTPLVEEEAEY